MNNKSKQVKSTEYAASGSFPVIDQSSSFICGYHDDPTKLIQTDLPLTVFGDHTRHTKFVSFPFIAGADGTQILKPRRGVDDKFFYYLVASAADHIGNYGYDRHFKHLKEFPCEYPISKCEQSKIAEVLSAVDRAIEQTRALIAKQQRIKTGLMQDLLTRGIDEHGNLRSEETHEFKDSPLGRIPVEWAVSRLDELAKHIIDCPHTTPHFLEDGVLVARTFNIKNGQFVGEESYVSEAEYRERVARLEPTTRDIVFTREAPVGEAFLVPRGMRVCLGQRTMLIRCDTEQFDPSYFINVLYSQQMRARFDQIVGGTTNPHLNVADVRSLAVKRPHIEEQVQIAEILHSIRSALMDAEAHRQKLVHLKTALMQDLLTGGKRVTPLLEAEQAVGSAS